MRGGLAVQLAPGRMACLDAQHAEGFRPVGFDAERCASFDDGGRRTLTGLYTINHEALRALDDATVLDFFRKDYLQLVYLMIASLKQVPVLARMKNDALLQSSAGMIGA